MTLPAPRRGRNPIVCNTVAALLTSVLVAQAQQPQQPQPGASGTAATAPAKKAAPAAGAASEKSAASYALGLTMGQQLKETGIGPDGISTERMMQGLRDALSGKAKASEEDRMTIAKFMRTAQEGAGAKNHSLAEKFLAENGKKPGVITTASGLEYKVLTEGSGAGPKPSDDATVNYKGTLLDGTEFDSSYKRGQPATFPVGRVIPGWTEGLQLMKPGGKYMLWVPPKLAYDLRSPPSIPPGSLLTFEVELLSVKAPPPAAPAGPAPGATPPAPK
jgi:FKBP-type peptidyl-prolyl cis-trans isomerase FkpA